MRAACRYAFACTLLAAWTSAGDARAEPALRYGAAFALGAEEVGDTGFEVLELTLQGSLRVSRGWRVAAHLHNLRLRSDEVPGQSGLGFRSGIGLERALASYTEHGGGAATASVRVGLTRDRVLWDHGRLDRSGVYVELRGIVDFATTPRHVAATRWFGLGLGVRLYALDTPPLLQAGAAARASADERLPAARDYGFVVSWEWTASR